MVPVRDSKAKALLDALSSLSKKHSMIRVHCREVGLGSAVSGEYLLEEIDFQFTLSKGN